MSFRPHPSKSAVVTPFHSQASPWTRSSPCLPTLHAQDHDRSHIFTTFTASECRSRRRLHKPRFSPTPASTASSSNLDSSDASPSPMKPRRLASQIDAICPLPTKRWRPAFSRHLPPRPRYRSLCTRSPAWCWSITPLSPTFSEISALRYLVDPRVCLHLRCTQQQCQR